MVRIVRAAIIIVLWGMGGTSARADGYAWPLRKFSGLTSLFGDYRPGRYHAGIDLRTEGQEGWPVVAVADGYVLRASTSYYGYGRALYLKLDDGRVAVYGHLQSFGPEVTRRVMAMQRQNQRYSTNQHFPADAIRVRRGMTIARSGQTGAGAPHLHFELRTADNEPLNPFTHGLPVSDGRDPEIKTLWLIPGYEGGVPGFGPAGAAPAEIALSGSRRAPLRLARGPIRAAGPVGFAVEAYDLRPGSGGRHNINGLLLVVNNDTVFQARFDTLDFATMPRVELERPLWLNRKGDAYALYKLRGNDLAHSRTHADYPGGFVHVQPGDTLPFQLVVTDSRENRRTILGQIVHAEPAPSMLASRAFEPPEEPHVTADYIEAALPELTLFPEARRHHVATRPDGIPVYRVYARDVSGNSVADYSATEPAPDPADRVSSMVRIVVLTPEDSLRLATSDSTLRVFVPAGAVYDTCFLLVRSESVWGKPGRWSVGPADVQLRKPLELTFVDPGDSLLSLWTINGKPGDLAFVERRRTEGAIRCTARRPATYTLAADITGPIIRRLWPGDGSKVRPDVAVRAYLEDEGSGVGNDSLISVLIDGEWVLPEYDPETHRLVARPWERLAPGWHTLIMDVSDWAGNRTTHRRRFRVTAK